MISVVKRHFRQYGIFYPAGTIIENPAGLPLYNARVGEDKIAIVGEHNIDDCANFLEARYGIKNAKEMLQTALYGIKDPAALEEAATVDEPITDSMPEE